MILEWLDKYFCLFIFLTRQLIQGEYNIKEGSIPVKWSAPEVIEFGKFSSKSDVYSFGGNLYILFKLQLLFGKFSMMEPGLGHPKTTQKLQRSYKVHRNIFLKENALTKFTKLQ